MKRTISTVFLSLLSACAIEGVGFDGRVNAYTAAAQDSREYVALHVGARDRDWYKGWCDALAPHFQRMDETRARVSRYCEAMQAQSDNAETIRAALVKQLVEEKNAVVDRRNSVLAGLSAFSSSMQEATPKPVTCNTTQWGNSASTTCY